MTKVVIINDAGSIKAKIVGPTGAEHRHLAGNVMEKALNEAGLSFEEITYLVATGYGRINVPFADKQITELTCHAKGVAVDFPNVRCAIDIGGQDAKGLKILDGKLLDFVMNDKCAAGTGRFLEVLAVTLGLNVADLGPISLEAKKSIAISSICTIFAKKEVVTYLSEGAALPDIIAGLHDAIAGRVVRMVNRLKIEPDVVLTGGVAKNVGVVKAVRDHVGHEVFIPPDPLITGAMGAAVLGREKAMKAVEKNKPLKVKKRIIEKPVLYE
jgi:(R)-2-hydroxyacyl-CoA dehydratese activating ATPase